MQKLMQLNKTGYFLFSLLCLFSSIAAAAPTGEFRYPGDNHTFNGNLLFSGKVEDPDGIGSVRLRFDGNAARQITVCNNCGNTESFTDAGINPRDYNLSIGSHQAQIVVIKNGSERVIDSVRFSWTPPEISGIEITRTFGSIEINWSGLSGYSLYNLYVASEAEISPNNIDSLPDSVTFRALRATSQTIEDIDDELGLFGLITGTDTSGESAYSQIFRIEALNNEDPEVVSENISVDEDSSVTGNVLSNDSDPEEQPLTAELNFSPNNGEVTLSENGDFRYQPAPDFNGEDSFTYVVNDPQGGSEIGTVSITVRPVNDAPTANNDSFQVAEDAILSVSANNGLLSNDSDIDGDSLSTSVSRLPDNGTLSLDQDGSFSYQPNAQFFGTDSFSYQLDDGNGATDTATVTIAVAAVNDLPVAANDTYQVNEDNVLSVTDPTQGVLANDSDADLPGEQRFSGLTTTLLSQPGNGTVSLQSNGTFTYTPAPDFFGSDSFSYQVADSEGETATATVLIEVLSQPESPIAEDDFYSINEDEPLLVDAASGVLTNDDNITGNQVSVTVLSGTQSGDLNLNGDGSFSYTPDENFNGTDAFSYQLAFADGTSQATVTIEVVAVNDAPVVNDDTATTDENTPVTITPLENDSNPDGDTLSVIINSVSSGNAVVSAETDIIFTPETDFDGEVSINYSASDSLGGITQGTIIITVLPSNAPPVAVDDLVETNEDTPVVISPLDNDSDPNDDILTLSIISVSAGTAELASTTSITYIPEENFSGTVTLAYRITDPSDASADGVITINVVPVNDPPVAQDDSFSIAERETLVFQPLENDSDIDSTSFSIIAATALTGELTFSADSITYVAPQEPGTDTITYTIADTEGEQASATISVTITNVDDTPEAVDDSAQTAEDTAITLLPLENDSDPDGDPLTLAIVSVTEGSAQITSEAAIEFTPETDFNGTASIIYSITDPGGNSANGTITITVTAVNDAPQAQDDEISVAEEETITLTPMDNDSDVDGDSLSIISAQATSGDVSFSDTDITYTAPDTPGEDTVTYTISDPDGETATATISITINNVQDAPVAEDDSVSTNEDTAVEISPLENDTDEDGDSLSVTINSVTNGSAEVTASETIIYSPEENFFGTASIVYTATDTEGNSDSATITITVTPVNDAPDARNDSASTNEDTSVTVSPLANDSDAENDPLTIEIITTTNGTSVVNADNSVTFTPETDFNGSARISYTLFDSSNASDTARISITVIAVNDAPIATDDTATVDEGESITLTPLDNDSDVEGDDLSISAASAQNGVVTISTDAQSLTYTAETNFSGTDTISYTVTDGTDSDTGTITVTVNNVNTTPVANSDSFDVFAGETTELDVLANDSDVDGDTLSITQASATLGTVTISNDESFISYTAPSDTTTTDSVSYTISDPSGATASSTASISIAQRTLEGEFDTDGDGNSDVTASADGNDYTVTFGEDVDAVYYQEDGSFVSVAANDEGVFELTIEGTSTSDKSAKQFGGIKSSAPRDFVLPATINTVYYTINGIEYSFTVSNLNNGNANVAFGPPASLNDDFIGIDSHDFYVRQQSFTGPLRLGVENGEHYILNVGGTGMVRGADYDLNVTWQETDGELDIQFINAEEFTAQFNVYDLDDDDSDGVALHVITKAEADAYVAAHSDAIVSVYLTEARQVFRFLRDNRIFVDAEIDLYLNFRIDSSEIPEITSADAGVTPDFPTERETRQLWDIDSLKIQKLTYDDLAAGIATDVPLIDNDEFEGFIADFCYFSESAQTPKTGMGTCTHSGQEFNWSITSDVLTLDFGNQISAAYRWLDDLAVENTFSVELTVGTGTEQQHYSTHVYWLSVATISDTETTSLLSNHYFDSAFSKSNPDARDTDKSIKIDETFGFYFDDSGLGKNLSSRFEFVGTTLTDTDRRWELHSGAIHISSLSSLSSGNAFSYAYDQCTDSDDASCFAWEVRVWYPIAVSGDRLWVWEMVKMNPEGPFFDGVVSYEEHISPRINYYELNSQIPGAPDSINFNQEPVWHMVDFNTDINTPVSNLNMLSNFADPEANALTILSASANTGTLTINSDNSLSYVPEVDFIGDVDFYLEVSDGINRVYPVGVISVLTENVAPVANNDNDTAFSGIQTALFPLDNDTDENGDLLTIISASTDVGEVEIDDTNTELDFTAPASFEGTATISYTISDGRTGTDSATISVAVTLPIFSGSYNFDDSNVDDFVISVDGSDFKVLFGEEVSAVYYEVDGKTHVVARHADGAFEFVYPSGETNIAQLYYVIDGVTYSFAPDDLNLTTPNLVYFGETDIENDFADKTEYLLITRHPTHNSALSNGNENGIIYDLQSSGVGNYSSSHFLLSDSITWDIGSNGIVTVNFDSPQTSYVYYNVYDLDDQANNDGALGVITKAEADAYYLAYNDFYVPVTITTLSHKLDAYNLQGYFYDVNVNYIQSFQIDSDTYPEITSANDGVVIEISGESTQMLDIGKFDFLTLDSSDFLGTIYLPIIDNSIFVSDECNFIENSVGSNDGSASCTVTGRSFTWSLESDGSISADFGNNETAVYKWLDHSEEENTLVAEAEISFGKFSTLSYWLVPESPSASEVTSIIESFYLERSESLSNPHNYDSDGQLNQSIGNGLYFDNSGWAKSIFAFFDNENNIATLDYDHQWLVDNSGIVTINSLSNLSSNDAFKYRHSQCTNSNDQNCFIWQARNWHPIKIVGDRIWVLDYQVHDVYQGYYVNPPVLDKYSIEGEIPKIRFYEPREMIPGAPNSISFNQEPVFTEPGFSTTLNTVANFDILSHVTDPESDPVTLIDVEVASGTVIINTDETITYTPATSFSGTVQMKLVVSDGVNTTTFSSYISVHSANNAPIANNDTVNAVGSHIYSYQVLSNDTDADSDPLTITSLSTTASGFNISSDNAAIEYNAPASLTATETVTYTVSDGNGGTDSATLTVNLVPNSAPVAVDDNLSDVTVGTAASLFPLSNDTDADGDSLTITAASSVSGSAVISGDGLSLSFTSATAGANSINYAISDEYGGSDTGVIFLNAITAGNIAPVANNDSYVVTPSSVNNLTPLSNDTDANSNSLVITSSSASVGTSVISNGGLNIDYTATASTGSDTISYTISDGNGGTDSASISITINNAPDAVNDSFSGLEDQSHTLSPLSNDSDADGDSFVITSVNASAGTAIKLNDSQISYSNPTAGAATITYQITDAYGLTDSASISFTVTNRPTAVNDSITINELATLSISPLDNDTDVESANSALILTSVSGSAGSASIESGDRTVSYTATLQSALTGNQDFITYIVEDEDGGTDSGTITINVNAIPVVQNDIDTVEQGTTVTLSPLSNDSDSDSDPLTISSASATNGNVSITGSGTTLDYTAPAGAATTDTISYTASDGNGGSASGSITITVTNNSPVSVNDNYTLLSVSGISATVESTVGVLANDTDPNADSLTASIVSNPAYASTFTLNADGSFSYEHNSSNNLSDSFVYQVSDGTYTTQGTASLTIKRANFTPDVCTIPAAYAQAGESYSQTFKVLDHDEENQTFSISGEPAWMTLNTIDGITATLTGTPTTSDVGTTTITFSSTDGFDSDSVTFDLTVVEEFATSNNLDFDFGGTTEVVYDAVIDNYGNIVVVGTSDGDFAVTRLLRDGTTDSAFNSGAVKTYDFGGADDVAISVKVRPDNGLIIAGHTNAAGASDYDFAVMALHSDGSLDNNFSTDGIHTLDAGGFSGNDLLAEVLVHDNADITLVGQSFESGNYKLIAVQLNSGGSIDSSFNSGSALSIYGIDDVNPEAAIEDGEGNIYVIAHGSNNTDSDIILARFSVDDGSNNDFANAESYAPLFYFNDSADEYGYDLAFDIDGNIIVAGTQDDDFALYKFTVTWDNTNSEWDVAQDSSFNSSTGENIIDLNGASTDFAYSMVPDYRGNYYIAGKQGTNTSIIRISADGTLDTSYGTSGVKTLSLSSGVSNTPTILRTDAMGQLLIFDTEDAGSDAHISVTFDYILAAPSFGFCDYTGEYRATSNKTQDQAIDITKASDNNYFIAGWSLGQDDSNKDFVVIKTDDQGNFDTAFGDHGYVRIDAGASTSITPYDVIGLGSQDLVIAGVETGTDDLYLAKLTNSGELDSGFDSDGIRDFGGSVSLTPSQGLYHSATDTFLIAGKDGSNFYPWVYRFNADGSDDNSFGAGTNISSADAGVNYTVLNDANFSVYDMVQLNSGDIYLIGGYFDTYNKAALIKMDADGLIDTGFGSSGIQTFDQGSAHVGFTGATDGTSIYILSKDTSSQTASVIKVNAAGSLDSSFDDDGLLALNSYEISATSTSSMQTDSSGDLWIQVSKYGSQESMVKLTSNGVFDSSFVNAGSTQFSHGVFNWGSIAGFALTASDEALLFGTTNNDFTLVTMSAIGEVNNHDNQIVFDHGYGEHALAIALDAYSGPILAGYGRNLTDYDDDMAIAKFDNSGNGDNSFGSYGQTANAIEMYSPNNESSQFHGFSVSNAGQYFATGESQADVNIVVKNTLSKNKQLNSKSGLKLNSLNTDIYNARIASDNAVIDILSYGTGLIDLLSGSNDLLGGQYLADDGYLYVVGSTNNIGVAFRYDPFGSFDSSFNSSSGTIELSSYSDSYLTAITSTSDGSLVAVGYYDNSGDIDGLIVKFSPDGTLDSSFSGDGIYEYQVASSEQRFFDVTVDGDGVIYAVGESNDDMLVVALDNQATLAESWNSTGILTTDIDSSSIDTATAVNVDAFGALFILVNTENEFTLLRYKPNGTLISDFGGVRRYSPINKMRDIAIDSMGNVFVTGSTQVDQQWQFFTVRFPIAAGPYQ